MPPPRGPSAGFLSSRGAKLLIGLPLVLAAFALTLQVAAPSLAYLLLLAQSRAHHGHDQIYSTQIVTYII